MLNNDIWKRGETIESGAAPVESAVESAVEAAVEAPVEAAVEAAVEPGSMK